MPSKEQVLIPIILAAAVIGVAGLVALPSDIMLEEIEFSKSTIGIDDHTIQIQIAYTDAERARGLMFQEELPHDEAMLFILDKPDSYTFWMLNMQFPLDIMWFDENGKVVHIEENIQPCKSIAETATCTKTNVNKKASFVLEATAGFVDRYNITKDSVLHVDIDLINS